MRPTGENYLTTEPLLLPRPLVNQLLRGAQQSSGFSRGLVLRDAEDNYQCVLLSPDTDPRKTAVQWQSHGQQVFAYFRTSQQPLPPPSTAELAATGIYATHYLGVALDIKGVLQLRGWRLDGTQRHELQVSIHELPS